MTTTEGENEGTIYAGRGVVSGVLGPEGAVRGQNHIEILRVLVPLRSMAGAREPDHYRGGGTRKREREKKKQRNNAPTFTKNESSL